MPVHDGSRSDPDERLPPPGPERFQPNPEQLVQGSHSTARSLRVQSQQLLTQSQVFEDEVLSGPESADHPPEEMPERQEHGKNLIGTVRIELFAKSYILRAYDVLARHRATVRQSKSLPAIAIVNNAHLSGLISRQPVSGQVVADYSPTISDRLWQSSFLDDAPPIHAMPCYRQLTLN